MPPICVMLGGVHLSYMNLTEQKAKEGQEAVLLKYGAFIQTVVDFLIIAVVIFAAVKIMNTLKREEVVEESLTDRKSTRMNYSHVAISYAVICFNKKNIS